MKNKNLNETANLSVSANGDSPEDIVTLFNKIFRPVTSDMMPVSSAPMPMTKAIDTVNKYSSDDYYSEPAAPTMPSHNKPVLMGQKGVEEEWANEPDEKMVKSVAGMTKDAGIQRKQVPHANKNMGDNPMAMEAYIREEYKKFKAGINTENVNRDQDPFIIACREVAAQSHMVLEGNRITEGALMDRIGKIAAKIRGKEDQAIDRAQQVFSDGSAPAAQKVLGRLNKLASKASNPKMLLILASMAGALVSLHASPAQAQQGAEIMNRALSTVTAPGHDGRNATQGLNGLIDSLRKFDAQNPGALSAPRAAPARQAAPTRQDRPEPTRDELDAWSRALGMTPPARR